MSIDTSTDLMQAKIFVHLPAYREPELIPTIEDALKQASNPKRIIFGICRQFHPDDKFDNLDKYRKDKRFKIYDMPHEEAKGLPYARAIINEELLEKEDYVLQLDSHHRFIKNWDKELIDMHSNLEKDGYKPLLTGYLPEYKPFDEPHGRTKEPWMTRFNSFYPHGTIFIQPTLLRDWKNKKKPVPARFCSGHFCFGRNKWAKEIKHDTDIWFAGEELNLTVRSYTHGYDLFHPHKIIIWHATMREERQGILAWDDQHKRGDNSWFTQQDIGRAKIRQLLRTENNGFDLTGYDLGKVRSLRDYEKYAGINFKLRAVQEYTAHDNLPPNPIILDEQKWLDSFMRSTYHLVHITPDDLPEKDYNFILVAFDDEKGENIDSQYIEKEEIEEFFTLGKPIHFEKAILSAKTPARVVYWGHSEKRGWAERKEINLLDD